MRNLLLLLSRFYHFFLFLFLELICILLVIRNNQYHDAKLFNMAYEVTGKYYDVFSDITGYFRLREANQQLQRENAALRSRLKSSFLKGDYRELIIEDSSTLQRYVYLPSLVVNNTVSKRNNYLTLNKGTKQGISERMGVVSSTGIVGIVRNVSPNFSSVISILHTDFRLSCSILESGYIGSLVWPGENPRLAKLTDIPGYVELKKGQHIVSSPYSSIFPEGLLVGKIHSFNLDEGNNFYEIFIELSVDFQNIREAYVVKDLMKDEKESLEQMEEE